MRLFDIEFVNLLVAKSMILIRYRYCFNVDIDIWMRYIDIEAHRYHDILLVIRADVRCRLSSTHLDRAAYRF
jgi:hypothetical protein